MGPEAVASREGAGSETGRSEDRGRRFAAFISYSHADKEAAAKLQRRLERYRLPKHLAIERAGGAAAIGRIFRDREDLAAAPSLSDAIRDAIARADALIVICSPDARASRWVSEEITLFRALHPHRPILAALVGGDHSTAFPEALTQDDTEPLAADLRKDGDGQTLGFLKIVAGIAGVPLDALVQRDAQRRVRRVTWITAGALAAMLVMGVMTTLAIQARNEAARQRVEAEGLVEYMLTDLREKLKGVGRLEVMDGVNQRAMTYYQAQGDLSRLPADSLERRARLLQAMGEDHEKIGNLDAALAKFSEAHRTTRALLSKEPNSAARLLAHAQSEYWVGLVQQKKGAANAALKAYRRYAELAEKAEEKGGDAASAAQHRGWAHNSMGVVEFKLRNDPKAAIKHFAVYRDLFSALVARNPKDTESLFSLADAFGWLADSKRALRNFDGARTERTAQNEILDRLLAIDPKNNVWLWARIGAERDLFRLCLAQKELRCADQYLSQAEDRLNTLSFDRRNRDWLWQSAYVSLDRGFLAMERGNRAQALQALAEGEANLERYRAASEGDREAVAQLEQTAASLSQQLK